MWDKQIALQLRRRGHDVIAATEPEHATRYRHTPDEEFFLRAQEDRRVVVTDNVADFEPIRLDREQRGETHYGVIYALAPGFDRHQPRSTIGAMVRALDAFLNAHQYDRPLNSAHYLHRSS